MYTKYSCLYRERIWMIFTCHRCTGRYCWERVVAMGILSVRPSVHLPVTTQYGFKARWDRDSGSPPYDSLESLVSYEVIWCHWVKRFPSNKGIKEGYPLRNRYFTIISSSSMKTVADRHRLAADHNKHCRRAFQWYQHRWPWATLNPQNMGFKWFFCYFRLRRTVLEWIFAEIYWLTKTTCIRN